MLNFRVALVGPGQLFGEEDIINENLGPNRCYTSTVKCISSTAQVYCMKQDEFLRKFKINKESWKVINEVALQKEFKAN